MTDANGKILKRTRERFGGDEGDEEDTIEDQKVKKARFPKGKKGQEEKIDEGEEGGPIMPADARAVATERAVKRKEKGKNKLREDTDVGSNVGGAEQDYDDFDDEQGFVRDEEGTKLEPFSLKKEREDGYFDAEGNYVEYRQENDARDAWLEGVKVDPSLAKRAAAEQAAADEVEEEMSTGEMAGIKRRIADTLQDGETVLQGLRRLGGAQRGNGGSNKQGGRGKGRGAATEEKRMSDEEKKQFDGLTEDASRLMEAGEYNVYSDRKETFLREAEGYEAIHRLRATAAATAGDDDDMFADDDAGPSTAGGKSGTSSNGGPVNGAGAAADGGVPAKNSGFVFDEASGYYYNSEQGYYYDPGSSLYCNASTQQWYYLNPETNSYEEVKEEKRLPEEDNLPT